MIKIMLLIIFFRNFKVNVQLYLIYSLDSLKQQMSVKTVKIYIIQNEHKIQFVIIIKYLIV